MAKKISQITVEESTSISDTDWFHGEETGGTSFKTLFSVIKSTLKTYLDTLYVALTGNQTIAGVKTFSSDPLIPDEAYDATNWNGVLEPPTKNAVRDKFESLSGSGGAAPTPPLGRLTLTTATPVLTADVANATTIYYTPYKGDLVPIYSGSWTMTTFTELSLALDSNSGDTGYHQSGKIFDLFVYSDSGTLRLVSGPAWTNDTTRATALEYVNGILMNAASMTARYGSATGNTVTVAQDRGTYVGTFYASANGQTTWEVGGDAANGDPIKLYLWNAYNRVEFDFSCHDTTDSWTYSTSTWRSKNASDTNRASFVRGLQEDGVMATNSMLTGKTVAGAARWGIALDATNTFTVNVQANETSAVPGTAIFSQNPGLGFHYLQAVEWDSASGVTTWYGDNAGNNRHGLTFRGWF